MKSGQMVLSIKGNMSKVRRWGKENSHGKMDQHMRVISTITLRVSELTPGPTSESLSVSGNVTKCMVKECSHGLMVDDLKGSTSMIKSTAMAFSIGLMVGHLKVPG